MKKYLNVLRTVLLTCMLINSIRSFCQEDVPKFKRLSTNEGLSQGHVSAIIKDKRGFMWFATDDGLNRYDGYRFKVYKHEPTVEKSLSNNMVLTLLEDKTGTLWIGTSSGLDKYDRDKDVFTHIIDPNFTFCITTLFQDSKNRIWVGTLSGLYLFDPLKNTFKKYKHNSSDPNSISHDLISRITEDDNGELWIGTRDGLNHFNPATQRFVSYKHNPRDKHSISSNRIKTVFKDSKGRIWIGTQGQGIALFKPERNGFRNFRHDPNNKNSVSHNDILSFTEDKKGALWIGTENGGISVFDFERNHFTCYLSDPMNAATISNNSIHSLYKDDIGNIWAGTWSGGVNFRPDFGSKFTYYGHIEKDDSSLSNNAVLSISGDTDGDVWIGTDGGGLNKFDPVSKKFTRYRNNPHDKNSIATDYVITSLETGKNTVAFGYHRLGFDLFNRKAQTFSTMPVDKNGVSLAQVSISIIFKDRAGNLWLGTHDRGGLYFYDTEQKVFTVYPPQVDAGSISGSSIWCILEDREGKIWVGTDDGLDLLDRKNHGFIHYKSDHRRKNSLSNNVIYSLFEDRSGNIWIGTGGGLNRLDKTTGEFLAFTEKDGLPNNVVYGILEDDNNNLWFSSNKGISRFNTVTQNCRNFQISDGLQDNSFKPNAFYKAPNGDMYFGGVNGFNVFNPDSIKDNSFIPPIVITDFRLFNESVAVGGKNTPLTRQITEAKTITLSHTQSVMTFEFAALNYTLPEKNQYAYKLKGFDKEWTYSRSRRTATYTNLDPGRYTLYVKGANNDGRWNKVPTSIVIIITPPLWATWWFKALILVGIAGFTIIYYKWRFRSIKRQKIALQRQVHERTAQLAHSMQEERKARVEAENANKSKSVFLATMSHEIRTPMNGVIGTAALLKQTNQTSEQESYTETIISCGEGLLNVINDILDFSKIESDGLHLENIEFDLRHCIEEVLDVFADKAAKTGLDLVYELHPNVPAQIIGDSLRLRQVLMNLVSNAIKFTHTGEIFVEVHLCEPIVPKLDICFEVRDTGIGIAADKIDRLFKPFSQVDSSTTRKYGGTGLGLVISEKLVKLMGGHIRVKSEPGNGTTFSFNIMATAGLQPVRHYVHNSMAELKAKRMLIVDDNPTNLRILKKQLEQWQAVPVIAETGTDALALLRTSPPFDLVMTDMNMPGMNGIELAQKIFSQNPRLPIILLSSVGDDRVKQYGSLFKAILTKPIKENILQESLLTLFAPSRKATPTDKKKAQPLSAEFSKRHPLHILIADDNPINRQLAIKVLNNLGYEPDVAEDGQEAVSLFTDNQYDMILMDVQMPEMDGMEATKVIRQQKSHVQPVIIAMTANAMQGDEAACLEAGMDDYLSKPIRIEKLVVKLEEWAVRKLNMS